MTKSEQPMSPEVKKWLSRAEAEAVLSEYPDADLSAFDIEGAPDVDALALAMGVRTLEKVSVRAATPRKEQKR